VDRLAVPMNHDPLAIVDANVILLGGEWPIDVRRLYARATRLTERTRIAPSGVDVPERRRTTLHTTGGYFFLAASTYVPRMPGPRAFVGCAVAVQRGCDSSAADSRFRPRARGILFGSVAGRGLSWRSAASSSGHSGVVVRDSPWVLSRYGVDLNENEIAPFLLAFVAYRQCFTSAGAMAVAVRDNVGGVDLTWRYRPPRPPGGPARHCH